MFTYTSILTGSLRRSISSLVFNFAQQVFSMMTASFLRRNADVHKLCCGEELKGEGGRGKN